MKYAKEIIDLMGPYPGREFRMAQIIRHVTRGRPISPVQRNAVREGVRRVLAQLRESGQIEHVDAGEKSAFYAWRGRLPHAVNENCHANCHNTASAARL